MKLITGAGNRPIGKVISADTHEQIFDKNNEYVGRVSEAGTFDRGGWKISPQQVPGLLLKRR
jgi:hypothetical protein